MAATPILAEAGGYIAKKIEDERGECVGVCVREGVGWMDYWDIGLTLALTLSLSF